MDSYMAGQRYMQRRTTPYRRRPVTKMRKGRLRRLIALQTLICIIILLILIIAKIVNISAARFLTDNARYILEHDVEPMSIYVYARTLVNDIRDSIAADRQDPRNVQDNQGNLNNQDNQDIQDVQNIKDVQKTQDPLSPQDIQNTQDMKEDDTFAQAENTFSGISRSSAEAAYQYNNDDNEFHETGVLSASSGGEESSHTGLPAGLTDALGSAVQEAPVEGELVTPFGEIAAAGGMWKIHNGIDIAVEGICSVKAILDGKVTDAGSSPGYGNYIRISHDNGLATVYANCSSIAAQINDLVKKGDVIAGVGGERVTGGRHLHFEVWLDGVPVDPLDYISISAR